MKQISQFNQRIFDFIVNSRKGERGMVLFLALGFITIFSLLAGGFVAIGIRNTHLDSDYRYASNALSTSEAGIQFAIGQLTGKEIEPPVPTLADSSWMTWVTTVVTPGYSSKVEISYVAELMFPHFNPVKGTIKEGDLYFRLTSTGNGPRSTEKKIEVITSPRDVNDIHFDHSMFFGGSASFTGNAVTYSGHEDTLIIKLDGNEPYMDWNNDDNFDDATEWGWDNGSNRLDQVMLFDPRPVVPPCTGLQYNGKVHANGNLTITGNPHFNGEGSSTDQILEAGGAPFMSTNDHYFRPGYANWVDSVDVPNIPTNVEYWEERALEDTAIHIVTPLNVGSYPPWTYVGGKFKWGAATPLPKTTYYLTDDVEITGNTTGNATIITDHDIKVAGNPSSISASDRMGYIAGGEAEIGGNLYIKGIVYSKDKIKFMGTAYIFGTVVVKGSGGISGNPIVIFNTALRDYVGPLQDFKHVVLSWEEVYFVSGN
jgi:hypothetical protein